MKKLMLSVDWDYFFPELYNDSKLWHLYDWGHRDAGSFFLEGAWYTRAGGFLHNDLPLPGTSGLEKTFWDRFKFSPDCEVFTSESHMNIFHTDVLDSLMKKSRAEWKVLSFDAHHDAGYDPSQTVPQYIQKDRVSCADWVLAYELILGIKTQVRYPKWKKNAIKHEPKPIIPVQRKVDDELSVPGIVDKVFICRSGGWSPSWVDDNFESFLASCPVKNHIEIQKTPNRQFDMDRAVTELKIWRSFVELRASLKITETSVFSDSTSSQS